MRSSRPSRALALILSLVPGWGHVYLANERLGLCLFTLAAIAAFGVIDLLLLYQGVHRLFLARSIAAAGILIWLVSFADVWRRTSPARRQRLGEEKARLLRLGMIAYLRDDLEAAEEAFRACLSLDHQDVEALMRLGVVLARLGQVRAARRWLGRARVFDFEDKWKWQIGRELESLRSGVQPPRPNVPDPGEKESAPPVAGGASSPAVTALEPPSAARE
jgi:tetratricopeptide (TPR) repeat protein